MLSRRPRGLAASIPLLVAVGLASGGCAGQSQGLRPAPPAPIVAQPTLQILAPSNVRELREAFNAATDRQRLIAFFSPT
jgi:hypothetical protein